MATQKDSAWNLSPYQFHRTPQALLVAFRTAPLRRPVRPQLTERQIAAENRESGHAAGICECDEERRLAVCPGTVGEDEAVIRRIGRNVKVAANGYFSRLRVFEGFHHG